MSPQEQGDFDIEAMEVRAYEASVKEYNNYDWQALMVIAQQWRDLGYPEDEVGPPCLLLCLSAGCACFVLCLCGARQCKCIFAGLTASLF